MLNFGFLEKGLGIVSLPHLVYDFLRKMFVLLYTLLSDQVSLPDCLYLLKYLSVCILQLFVNQVVTPYILKEILSF